MTAPRHNWWLIVRVDGATHCWELADTSDPDRLQDTVDRARVQVQFPPGDDWIAGDTRQNAVQLTQGEPHPSLMATAATHQLADLDRVTAQALAAYRAASDNERAAARMTAAREAVLRLTSEQRAQLYGDIPPPPRGTTTTGGRT